MSNKRKNITLIKYAIVGIILIAALVPQSTHFQNEVGMRAVMTAMGIDRAGDGYRVTAQLFIPTKGGGTSGGPQVTKRIVSVEAKSAADAFGEISAHTGRLTTPGHCRLIVLGKSVTDHDAVAALGFVLESSQADWSALVLAASGEAKEMIGNINELEKENSLDWQKYLKNSKRGAFGAGMDVKTFLNNNYAAGAASYLTVFGVKKVEEEAETNEVSGFLSVAAGGGEKGTIGVSGKAGESAGGAGDTVGAEIDARKRVLMIKDGKSVAELKDGAAEAVNWIDRESVNHTFALDVAGNPRFGTGRVTLECEHKRLCLHSGFEDGKPYIKVKMILNLRVTDSAHGMAVSARERTKHEGLRLLSDAAVQKISGDISVLEESLRVHKADIFAWGERFDGLNHRKYRAYLKEKSLNDFMSELSIKREIAVRIND